MASKSQLAVDITAKDKASKVLNSTKAAIVGLGAAASLVGVSMLAGKLVRGLKEATVAAGEQEAAEVKLAQSLRLVGQDAAATLPKLREHASALQDLTGVGDEVILSAQAQLVAMGKLSGDGLQRATKAALDLAAANGISVKTAFDLVAKAATGYTSSLSRYGIILDKGIKESDKFAAALGKIEEIAGGQAAAMLDTFGGRVGELEGRIGDLKEVIGEPLREVFKEVFGTVLSPVIKNITATGNATDIWRNIILSTAIAVVQLAIALKNGISFMAKWALLAAAAGGFLSSLAISLELIQSGLDKVTASAKESDGVLEKLLTTLKDLLENGPSGAGEGKPPLIEQIIGSQEDADNIKEMMKITVLEISETVYDQWQAVESLITQGAELMNQQIAAGLVRVESLTKAINKTIKSQLVDAALTVGDSMVEAAFGAKVAWGDMFKQFMKDIAKAIIQALILRAIMAALGMAKGGVIGGVTDNPGGVPYSPGSAPAGPGYKRGGIVGAQAGMLVGGMGIGRDRTPILARQGEAVLPRDLTEQLMSMADGGGGGPITVHVEMGPNMAQLADSLSVEVQRGGAILQASKIATSRTKR